jgi:hypothetical protein
VTASTFIADSTSADWVTNKHVAEKALARIVHPTRGASLTLRCHNVSFFLTNTESIRSITENSVIANSFTSLCSVAVFVLLRLRGLIFTLPCIVTTVVAIRTFGGEVFRFVIGENTFTNNWKSAICRLLYKSWSMPFVQRFSRSFEYILMTLRMGVVVVGNRVCLYGIGRMREF